MLECDFCGCYASKPGKGWAAYHRDDPDRVDALRVVVFCPPCAAAMHGLRPDAAREHVCFWKPQPGSGRPRLVWKPR